MVYLDCKWFFSLDEVGLQYVIALMIANSSLSYML